MPSGGCVGRPHPQGLLSNPSYCKAGLSRWWKWESKRLKRKSDQWTRPWTITRQRQQKHLHLKGKQNLKTNTFPATASCQADHNDDCFVFGRVENPHPPPPGCKNLRFLHNLCRGCGGVFEGARKMQNSMPLAIIHWKTSQFRGTKPNHIEKRCAPRFG